MKVTLIVLTWNEVQGVRAIMPQVDRSLFEQILVIDGQSDDGTIEWCKGTGI